MWFLFQTVFSEYPLLWEEQGAGHLGTSRQCPVWASFSRVRPLLSLPLWEGRMGSQVGLTPQAQGLERTFSPLHSQFAHVGYFSFFFISPGSLLCVKNI